MADYNEFKHYPDPPKWAPRYNTYKYNEVVCKSCGAIVHESWGIKLHDQFHMSIGLWK